MLNNLSPEEKATNYDTFRHIERVRNLLNVCVQDLLKRGERHDQTKLEHPEVALFTEFTPKLASSTYGSQEYNGFKEAMKPALQHHYANNSHHPKFYAFEEEWMDIIDYKGLYQVSNKGRIKSCEKMVKREFQGDFLKKESLRKFHITPKGYARLMLSKNGEGKNKFVHSLVAEAFLFNNKGENAQVNHKNGNKLDNSVSNLEWVTPSENLIHSYENSLRSANVKYVVVCNELNITTFGCEKMEIELKKNGYETASASSIYSCIAYDKNHSHLGLTFTSFNIEEYKEQNSYINDMSLLDIVEMLCDWKAASERHNDGNIRKSIEINADRFGMSPQLTKIFENTADILFGKS